MLAYLFDYVDDVCMCQGLVGFTTAWHQRGMQNIQNILSRKQRPLNVIYVSSYIPRKCGIATYTKDLTNAINLINSHSLAEILVVTPSHDNFEYPWESKFKILRDNVADYVSAVEYVNHSDADLVVLEHEFGLFGGEGGEYIVRFAEALKKPMVTTFHTVLSQRDVKQAEVVRRLSKCSRAVTVMMDEVARRLVREYHVPARKVVVIPHGVPDLPFNATKEYKRRRKMQDRIVLGNINLLSRNKGIEYALEAVAIIAKKYPQVLYVCVGQTHPDIARSEGEAYRNFLKKRVRELGIKNNVRFVNEYLSLRDLLSWLKTIDFYITPYLDPEQIASGALAYAVGAGKACVSTPYVYAKEVLAGGKGVLVSWKNGQSIADAVINLYENPDEKLEMEKRAYKFGRLMTWTHVAHRHLDLFRTVMSREAR